MFDYFYIYNGTPQPCMPLPPVLSPSQALVLISDAHAELSALATRMAD